MINKRKYQLGGAAPQGEGGVMQKIAQLPKDQQEQIMNAFASWAQQKGIDINQIQSNPQAMEQAMTQFLQEMQLSQAQAAKHGAKLQYIKDLKGTCPEGTHLEYYKAGGRLCKKCMKNQEGGEMKQEKKGGVLAQYKEKVNKDCNGGKAKKACGGVKLGKHQIGGTIETLRESLGLEKKNLSKFQRGGKNHWNFSERNVGNLGNGYSVTNHWIYQDKVNGLSQGDFPPTVAGRTIYTSPYRSDTLYWRNLDPDTWFLSEKVPTKSRDLKGAKLNFYRWVNRSEPESSSSNGAYQRAKRGFQSGGELPTAPRAEVRYANSLFIPDSKYAWHLAQEVRQIVPHSVMGGGMLPASIRRYIPSDGDTTYVELPEAQSSLFRPTVRYERKASFKNQKGQEYNILKRRFNTAVQMATQK